MILYHMDENWFYVVVTCSKYKVVIPIGLEGADHFFQYKNHVGKEMYIDITGYEVRNNDMANGERGFSVAIISAGVIVKADKDTFKRMYREDETYYYHRISETYICK